MRWKLQDLGLVLATEFLGAEDLHFGWFDPGEEATPETLIRAQKRYTDRLLAELPEDAHRVLDAGCGTGTMVERLRAQGREVEGLAPNPDLILRARERLGAGVPLHESPFETFRTDRPFDAVLMAESCQYIKRVLGLQAAARVLKPGGVLLIADVFRMKPLDRPYLSRGGHRHGIFLHTAASHGFEAELDQDITEAVLPTLELYHEFLSRRIVPSAEAVCRSFGSAYPVVNRAIRFFAGQEGAYRLPRERKPLIARSRAASCPPKK